MALSPVESDEVMQIASKGTRAQKLYLKKCADFRVAPCRHFLIGLSQPSIDMSHQNVGPKGAEACAFGLSVRIFNLRHCLILILKYIVFDFV